MDAVVKKIPRDIAAAPRNAALKRPSQEEAEAAVRTLIAWAGDDPAREGLRETPRRVVNAYREFFKGYEDCPLEALSADFVEVCSSAGGFCVAGKRVNASV